MRFEWRPLAAGELDHERLWLGVGAAACGAAALAGRAGLRPPRCLFHLATGYPCAGCGSTRALLQLLQGHLGTAFVFNPLATMAALAALLWAWYAGAVLIWRLPRVRVSEWSRPAARTIRLAVLAAVAANWCWVLARGW